MAAIEPEERAEAATVSSETVAAMRRLVESVVIAVATSTGLYLVGSVYTDAYYGRMSIEATALDLPPIYIGLQSMHVLQALLGYPTTLLVFYVLARLLASQVRWLRVRYDRARRRFERAVLLVTNLVVVLPLVLDAMRGVGQQSMLSNSTISGVNVLLSNVLVVLVGYVIWLSFGPRALIFTQIRERKIIPIVLVLLAYLLNALITTADSGAAAAEVFMLGAADSALTVEFTMRDELPEALSTSDLLLVTVRGGNYYVVERQSYPPDGRPNSYIVPSASVEFAHVRRLNEAGVHLVDFLDPVERRELLGEPSPVAP